jgi:hypothetical protein
MTLTLHSSGIIILYITIYSSIISIIIMEKLLNNNSVSEVSSLQSLNLTTTDSDISSVNDSLLAREMSIFEAIAKLVTNVFDNLLANVLITAKRSVKGQPKTPTEIEFELLKAEITKLNNIITMYKSIIDNHEAIDLNKIQECIDNIKNLQNDRQLLIDSFSKFIIIAKESPILQHSIIPKKVDTNEQIIAEYTKLFPGANIQLLKGELLNDELQTKLAKFIRAMTLLDNMKHRLNLKLMIMKRTHRAETNTEPEPNAKSQLLSVAVNIDGALKQFVDEPALSGELLVNPDKVLSSDDALSALQDIRNEAQKTVDRLSEPTAEQSSGISSNNVQLRIDMEHDDDMLTQPNVINDPDESMETVSNNLIELLTRIKSKMNELQPETAETELIDEIIEENTTIVNASSDGTHNGGKSHRRKHRTKRSTPRRRRNSRVKSMKPKKRQNRRKTKSNHKKHGTKKH